MKLSVKQFSDKLNKKISDLQSDRVLRLAALTVSQERIKRIFEDGERIEGVKIGSYSTKPMLATKDQFVHESKFKISKESSRISYKTNKQTGQKQTRKGRASGKEIWIKFPRASKAVPIMFIPGGYKEFRAIQGRESNFVNLMYTNELQSDLANAVLSKSGGIAKSNPIKISETQYAVTLKKEINQKKKEGLEAKYGPIFKHTKREIALFNKVVNTELNKIMKK